MIIQCEYSECETSLAFLEESHSMVAVLQRVDTNGYTFFQCDQGQDYNFVNWNHFHCSHEHMKVVFAGCINEHYSEEQLHPIPAGAGSTILHKIVLGSNLTCKTCSQPLTSIAYRFCLTRCTPINSVPDDSMNELGEWCCSLDHARQSALVIVASIQ